MKGVITMAYTKLFNIRTNDEQLNIWKKRAEERKKDLSSLIRELLKEEIL